MRARLFEKRTLLPPQRSPRHAASQLHRSCPTSTSAASSFRRWPFFRRAALGCSSPSRPRTSCSPTRRALSCSLVHSTRSRRCCCCRGPQRARKSSCRWSLRSVSHRPAPAGVILLLLELTRTWIVGFQGGAGAARGQSSSACGAVRVPARGTAAAAPGRRAAGANGRSSRRVASMGNTFFFPPFTIVDDFVQTCWPPRCPPPRRWAWNPRRSSVRHGGRRSSRCASLRSPRPVSLCFGLKSGIV